MKVNFRLLLTVAILFPLLSLAQGNYKPGFVITLKGDTLKGYIDLREWGSNPTSVNFKASLDKSDRKSFTVNDISYFEIFKVIAYKQFTTSISLDDVSIQHLTDYRDTSSKTDNVFLKVEQNGKNITLYSYTDDLKTRFYIYDSQTNKISELIYRIYRVPNDRNNVSTVSQNAYKQQLLNIAQKFSTYSDSFKTSMEDANYDAHDLILICAKINNTVNKEANRNKKSLVRFTVGAGLSFNTITRIGTFPMYNTTPSHNSVTPRAAVGFNFYPVPEVGKSIIRIELSYSTASYQTTGNLYYYQPDVKSTYSFGQRTLSLSPQFQYSIYNSDPFKFYLGAGLSMNLSRYSGNSVYNPVTTYTETNYSGVNQQWFSIPVKAGIILNKNIDISLSYNFPTSITDDVGGKHQDFNYSLKLSSAQATLNYIF
ncbi:MAG: hypothetical protein JWR02_9 [Mucilaginibacter sp.]|nr:hypothetical protein [Mucilaginibacter sp.]